VAKNTSKSHVKIDTEATFWRLTISGILFGRHSHLTMYCALSARPSLSADLSPCTGCYKLILLTLYGGPAAAVR